MHTATHFVFELPNFFLIFLTLIILAGTSLLAPKPKTKTAGLFQLMCAGVVLSGIFAPLMVTNSLKHEYVQHNYVLALDDSGSMTRPWNTAKAQDNDLNIQDAGGAYLATSFLDTYRSAVSKFANGRQIDTIGVVAYSDDARQLARWTDRGRVAADAVTGMTPQLGSTNSRRGLQLAIDQLKQTPPEHRVLVVVSDGDSAGTELEPIDASAATDLLKQLKDLHAQLFVFHPALEYQEPRDLDAVAIMQLAGARELVDRSPLDVAADFEALDSIESPDTYIPQQTTVLDLRKVCLTGEFLGLLIVICFFVGRRKNDD